MLLYQTLPHRMVNNLKTINIHFIQILRFHSTSKVDTRVCLSVLELVVRFEIFSMDRNRCLFPQISITLYLISICSGKEHLMVLSWFFPHSFSNRIGHTSYIWFVKAKMSVVSLEPSHPLPGQWTRWVSFYNDKAKR